MPHLNLKVREVVIKLKGDISKLNRDYNDFLTEALSDEICPECGCDVEVKQDGSSPCPECGFLTVIPCNACPHYELSLCDYDTNTDSCSFFCKDDLKKVIKK